MDTITTLIEGRNQLRREFDRLNRESNRAALAGDEQYELSANLAAEAVQTGELVKQHDYAIGALGGEPKSVRRRKKATA